jgi:hypothetical protein
MDTDQLRSLLLLDRNAVIDEEWLDVTGWKSCEINL